MYGRETSKNLRLVYQTFSRAIRELRTRFLREDYQSNTQQGTKANQTIDMKAIGTIHTPFNTLEDMPIQPKGAAEVIGTIELEEQYLAGLADLTGFSHIYLIYRFHMAKSTALTVTPFMDTSPRGVFATRSPLRPNHIGLSIVKLLGVEKNIITVQGIDILNETPLLDIKPYIAAFDAVQQSQSGWMKGSDEDVILKRSDNRFTI